MAEASDQAAELRVIRLARNSREAQAWIDIRDGRIEEALTWYRDEGCLRLYDTRPELLTGLVEDWWASEGRGVMVVDFSNEERDQLNRMAQARRLQASQVGLDALSLLSASGRALLEQLEGVLRLVMLAQHHHPEVRMRRPESIRCPYPLVGAVRWHSDVGDDDVRVDSLNSQ
jgi:hypothetical protein